MEESSASSCQGTQSDRCGTPVAQHGKSEPFDPLDLSIMKYLADHARADITLVTGGLGLAFSTVARRLHRLSFREFLRVEPMQIGWGAARRFYAITEKGFRLLLRNGFDVNERRARLHHTFSPSHLRHHYLTLRVGQILQAALKTHPLVQEVVFEREPRYAVPDGAAGKANPSVIFAPDSHLEIVYTTGVAQHHFTETDCGTVSGHRFQRRLQEVRHLYSTSALARIFMGPESNPQDFPFKINIVALTHERLRNLLTLASECGLPRMVEGTTFDKLEPDPLGAIWLSAGDAGCGNNTPHTLINEEDQA